MLRHGSTCASLQYVPMCGMAYPRLITTAALCFPCKDCESRTSYLPLAGSCPWRNFIARSNYTHTTCETA